MWKGAYGRTKFLESFFKDESLLIEFQRRFPRKKKAANSLLRLFETGESLQLLCPQGHLIKKKTLRLGWLAVLTYTKWRLFAVNRLDSSAFRKKLKPWQDIMAGDKVCNECQETINRDAFRWRCEYHCDCNICDDCSSL